MASLDDLPLGTDRRDAPAAAPAERPTGGLAVVLFGVMVALVLGAGVWYYVSRQRAADTSAAATTAPPPPPAPAEAVADPAPPAPPLPPRAEMDPYVRDLFATLSAHPELLKWLATDDLVGSIATAIDRLAQGRTPARDLAVLRPGTGFAVARRGTTTQADPASYMRYAPLVAAATTVEPGALARAFVTLKPRLEEAYIAQGHPGGGFDAAVRRAIQTITSTPDLPADAALVPGVGGYVYDDPAFERLPPAQKHLLRMGPDLSSRVREAARQFEAALAAITPAPAGR